MSGLGKGVFPKPGQDFIEIMDLLGKLCAFRGGNPFHPEASFIDSQKSKIFKGLIDYLLAFHITFQVMAVADVSPGDQNPVGTLGEGAQKEA